MNDLAPLDKTEIDEILTRRKEQYQCPQTWKICGMGLLPAFQRRNPDFGWPSRMTPENYRLLVRDYINWRETQQETIGRILDLE